MFYQCPKCKRVWQYLIEKCPHCFLDLEKMRAERVKVAAVSNVVIPSILHPKVPYFVLLLEDDKGNKWVQKSVKEYKIGDDFETQKNLNKEAVAVWRVKYDILEAIEKVIELLGGIKINSQTKILILPTLISPKHPYLGENTSPQFLEAAIKELLEKGTKAENIKVAGQSFDEIPIGASVQKSQLLNVCQEQKITALDLSKSNFVKKGNFEISEEIFSADLVLNLPILKIGKAAASENLFKFLRKENYAGLKYLSDEKEILKDLIKELPKILTVADAQSVQRADQFTAFLGLILASESSLNLDRVFAEISMAKLPEILQDVKLEDIPVAGRKVDELKYEVEKL